MACFTASGQIHVAYAPTCGRLEDREPNPEKEVCINQGVEWGAASRHTKLIGSITFRYEDQRGRGEEVKRLQVEGEGTARAATRR